MITGVSLAFSSPERRKDVGTESRDVNRGRGWEVNQDRRDVHSISSSSSSLVGNKI